MSKLRGLGTATQTAKQGNLEVIAHNWDHTLLFGERTIPAFAAYIKDHGGIAGFLASLDEEQEAEVRQWWPMWKAFGACMDKPVDVPDLPAP